MKAALTSLVSPSGVRQFFRVLPLAGLVSFNVSAYALEALDDGAMSSVNGAGIVYGLDDFSFRFAPTSYIELTGSDPSAPAAAVYWKRGDARYYGLSFTNGGLCNAGTGPGTGTDCVGGGNSVGDDWFGNTAAVTSGNELSYPIGRKTTPGTTNPYGIVGFASPFNPFILRVYQYPGYNYAGTYLSTAANMPTVLEFMGPTKTDAWRWAFWGEMEVGRGSTFGLSTNTSGYGPGGLLPGCLATGNGNTAYCGLQSQTIIHGSPTASGQVWQGGTTFSAVPTQREATILRMMQSTDSSDQSLALNYQSALSGNFRFSVQQTSSPASPNTLHVVPSFNINEGLYFKNVDAFLPLGTLNSISLTASGVSAYNTSGSPVTTYQENGNFVLELTRLPNVANVYNNVYCGQTTGVACTLDASGYLVSPNPDTHAYVRWGNWTTAAGGTTQINTAGATGTTSYTLPTGLSTANGIYFNSGAATEPTGASMDAVTGNPNGAAATNSVVNLGISRIEGMLIQHLKITTLGAGT